MWQGDGLKGKGSLTMQSGVFHNGIDAATLQTLAEGAKKGCPISKALAATPITLTAKLL